MRGTTVHAHRKRVEQMLRRGRVCSGEEVLGSSLADVVEHNLPKGEQDRRNRCIPMNGMSDIALTYRAELKAFMRLWSSMRVGCAILAASLGTVCQAASWYALGPFGGDARSLAADPAEPKHLFLGTATGWIYDSHDGGTSWMRVAQVANRNDLAIDHIVVDATHPKRLVVGAFVVGHPADGGLYISEDYGKNWYSQAEMRGQSVRALARSNSDPKELVAGTLKGVFRSLDNGIHWQQISPEGSTEIHEIQSIAIDPADANVIYAGTWHLPWKTTDGGATWHNIKEGVIDDSDVFSIIVDPKNPKVIYASACSGIYKSTSAGELFRKVQGIPSAARRTRTLEQDPSNLDVVFAGTTEGLYRTVDAGAQWERLTPDDVIVNDVYVDPTNAKHVLLATDRGGVYRSEDGGSTFETSNAGFSTRQVTAYASDATNPGKLYVGVVNGKRTGGVFESVDGAVHWQQESEGLGGRDIFSLLSLEDGTLLAGTEHGIYRLSGASWKDSSTLEGTPASEKTVEKAGGQTVKKGEGRAATRSAAPPLVRVSAAGRRQAAETPKKAKSSTRKPVSRVKVQGRSAHHGESLHSARAPGRGTPAVAKARLLRVSAMHQAMTKSTKVEPHHSPEVHTPGRLPKTGRLDAEVYTMLRSGNLLFAASGAGLLRSGDGGQHWTPVPALTLTDLHFLAIQPVPVASASSPAVIAKSNGEAIGAEPQGSTAPVTSTAESALGAPVMLAGGLTQVMMSTDGAASWTPVSLPPTLTEVGALCIDGDRKLWVGGREGIWFSADGGATWKTLRNLFLTEVDNLFYDSVGHRVLVTGASSPVVFSVQLQDDKVTYWDTGWKLRFARPVGDHLVGATLFDGMVVQPQMVDSPVPQSTASR